MIQGMIQDGSMVRLSARTKEILDDQKFNVMGKGVWASGRVCALLAPS